MNFDLDPNIFLEETDNLLEQIKVILLNVIEYGDDDDAVNDLFRLFHSLKGNADIFGYKNIVSITHKLEDLLDLYRTHQLYLNAKTAKTLLKTKNFIELLTEMYTEDIEFDRDTEDSINYISSILKKEIHGVHYQLRKREYNENKNKKAVLIVDSLATIRSIAAQNAQDAGYKAITAGNGEEGLEAVKNDKVDLIFTDINLLKMNGFEMIKKIKENPEQKSIPIVVLTEESKEEMKRKGRALGVNAWMLKPFNHKKFSTALKKILI